MIGFVVFAFVLFFFVFGFVGSHAESEEAELERGFGVGCAYVGVKLKEEKNVGWSEVGSVDLAANAITGEVDFTAARAKHAESRMVGFFVLAVWETDCAAAGGARARFVGIGAGVAALHCTEAWICEEEAGVDEAVEVFGVGADLV